MGSVSDEILVKQALSGRRGAFEELVDRHRTRVFSVLLRTIGDRDMAEDLTQETFIRAYRRLDAFSPEVAQFSTWLVTIAARIGIDAHRRKKPGESLERLSEEKGFDPPSEGRTERGAESEAVSQLIHASLSRLPERQRMAVTLKHIEDLPFTEVARIMGCSVNSAKVHAHRGRKQLAVYLGHLREEAAL